VTQTSKWIDLHLHSTASDGQLTPVELMAQARQRRLSAVALTDHDTTAGLAQAAKAAAQLGVGFVPGIELSAEHQPGVMHLLGYFIDPDDDGLRQVCQRLVRARRQRNERIIERLTQLGCHLTMQQVLDLAAGEVVGRPHIARAMVAAGAVKNVKQAFVRYLAKGSPAYVSRDKLSAADAVAAITRAGGVVALAHPAQLGCRNQAELDLLIRRLTETGIHAIEVHHPDHRPEQTRLYMKLADRYGLAMAGGSDFHGPPDRNHRQGGFCKLRIPHEWLEQLRTRLPS